MNPTITSIFYLFYLIVSDISFPLETSLNGISPTEEPSRGVRRVINSTEEFSGRTTVKSNPDGRKFRRFKCVGTRASYVVMYEDATAGFRSKMRNRESRRKQSRGCYQWLQITGSR